MCGIGSIWVGRNRLDAAKGIEPVSPITRHNPGDLPAVETLVRPSDLPPSHQEAVIAGLRRLDAYDPGTETTGLVAWMQEIICLIILRDRRATARQPDALSLVYGLSLPANPSEGMAAATRSSLQLLPPEIYSVVIDHLDGYENTEIVGRNRIHRNTVANRRELAAETLRCHCPAFVAIGMGAVMDTQYNAALNIRFDPEISLYRRREQSH